jgi:poly-beta-1,6-N-acetyl-D-glucosamine synthase
MITFYLIWSLSYFFLLSYFARKWPKNVKRSVFTKKIPRITLLIPVRNEARQADALAKEIRKITYPKLEILLIDDQSEDGTLGLLQEYLKDNPRVRFLLSPGAGKKVAIEYGVEMAAGELIVSSDADCQFPEKWIEKLCSPFEDTSVQLVAGPVMNYLDKPGFFQNFQQIEWSSILLITWVSFLQSKPLMCSGANMAYRKSAFKAVSGYADNRHVASGDDEFLLKKIVSHFGHESFKYLPHREVLVLTEPQRDFFNLINQRIRWAAKWKAHRSFSHAFSSIVAFFAQVIWLGSFFLLVRGIPDMVLVALVWIFKFLAERIALGKVLNSLNQSYTLKNMFLTSIFHPMYVLWVGIGAMLGKFTWKDRRNGISV